MIIDRRVNIGQTVVASLNAPSLFLIARDLRKMRIWAAVNEADVGRIKPGALVTFSVDAFPGREFQATVGKGATQCDDDAKRGPLHGGDQR